MKSKVFVPKVEAVGVYMIENIMSGKRYVGSSVNVYKRMSTHAQTINGGHGINVPMEEDVRKGFDVFRFIVLETFKDGTITSRELQCKEREYTETMGGQYGYNVGPSFRTGMIKKDTLLYVEGTELFTYAK